MAELSCEDFLDWLACAVMHSDWESNPGFYQEVICRKLVRMGLLELKDDKYYLPEPRSTHYNRERAYTPSEVVSILVTHGQSDKQFRLGEIIKYSPSDVEKILLGKI